MALTTERPPTKLSEIAYDPLQRVSTIRKVHSETPASNYGKNKRRLDALLPPEMPAWRLHDLRRTVASGMARLGINLPVIEKALNHSSGSFAGIVAVYQRQSFADEKRKALDAWADLVVSLVGARSDE